MGQFCGGGSTALYIGLTVWAVWTVTQDQDTHPNTTDTQPPALDLPATEEPGPQTSKVEPPPPDPCASIKRIDPSKEAAPPPVRGRPPVGIDGKPIEIHHDAQTDNGGMTEMTFSDHRGGENFKKDHKNTGQEESKVDRNKFRQNQWDSGRWSGGCFDEVNESNRTNGTSGSKGEKME